MTTPTSSTPSLTPSRSPSPQPPVQPDHFYGNDNAMISSPSSDGRTWLDPADDPLAQRGIPVFKPTMEEFQDFEGYMNRVECWGVRSGIVKIIPPKEWTDSLPPVNDQLAKVKLRNPIEQLMLGRGGLFHQQNIEKRRVMSVREWAELCSQEDLCAPGVDDVGLHARARNGSVKPRTRRARRKGKDSATAEAEMAPDVKVKDEIEDENDLIVDDSHIEQKDGPSDVAESTTDVPVADSTVQSANSERPAHELSTPDADRDRDSDRQVSEDMHAEAGDEKKPDIKPKRRNKTKEEREAAAVARGMKDAAFLETFDPHSDWLPPNTTPFDYTVEFCKELERRYWRNCGLRTPPWYGADMAGSLFTEATTAWNVASLPSALSRLLPASSKGLPGVNTPYLYFGMWRATFAWHVEDMDLFSINYIHFGAPKFWYAIPQARSGALEQAMRGYFPESISQCPQFLRHKSFLASPTLLSQSSCRPNTLVQQAGEFVITYPRGYHAGFNLGFNCAESVNFALDSWLELGRKAKVCECVSFSVRIDVDELLEARRAEQEAAQTQAAKPAKPKVSRKRKQESTDTKDQPKAKKIRVKASKPETASSSTTVGKAVSKPSAQKLTLKLGPPKVKEPETFPCCLCVSQNQDGLLRVHDPPLWRKEAEGNNVWMAHEECANVIPETWVDEIETPAFDGSGESVKERVVFGVDAIVKDRWNLKCTACTKPKSKAHGAPIQCTKGKCPKAFHVSCARDGSHLGIIYCILREVEKEVVLLDTQPPTPTAPMVPENPGAMAVDPALLYVNNGSAIQVDGVPLQLPAQVQESHEPSATVLKLIKKSEVQVLCSQHNPAIAEAKKAQKQDKIRNELLALPPLSRIKLRVSAGVFEVTLCRVIEESKSVEVVWDRGMKREFKWGSVVFGTTETVVGQKPAEPAAEPPVPRLIPVSQPAQFAPLQSTAQTVEVRPSTYQGSTSTPGAGPSHSPPAQPNYSPPPNPPAHATYPQPNCQSDTYQRQTYYTQPGTSTYQYPSGHWNYQYSTAPSTYSNNPAPYAHSSYYRSTYTQPSYPQYHGFSYQSQSSMSAASSYPQYQQSSTPHPVYQQPSGTTATMRRELQWQRPYTGPKAGGSHSNGYSAPPNENGAASPTDARPLPRPQEHRPDYRYTTPPIADPSVFTASDPAAAQGAATSLP